MTYVLVFFGLVAVLVLAVVAARKGKSAAPKRIPVYQKKNGLFSPAERSFLGVLDKAIEGQCIIQGHVRLADMVEVRRGLSNSERQTAFNKIQSKHIDFVLCRKDDLSPICAIELDDKSHKRPDRVERDRFLGEVFNDAELPFVRFEVKSGYKLEDVRSTIAAALKPQVQGVQKQSEPASTQVTESSSGAVKCPKCSAPMVRRMAKSGDRAGKEFWGCSAYPKCKTIVPV